MELNKGGHRACLKPLHPLLLLALEGGHRIIIFFRGRLLRLNSRIYKYLSKKLKHFCTSSYIGVYWCVLMQTSRIDLKMDEYKYKADVKTTNKQKLYESLELIYILIPIVGVVLYVIKFSKGGVKSKDDFAPLSLGFLNGFVIYAGLHKLAEMYFCVIDCV